MKNSNLAWRVLLMSVLMLPGAASAQDEVYVPDDLEPWTSWVLHGREYLGCPFLFDSAATARDSFLCAWPGELELAVDAGGARFSQGWTVYAEEQWIPLPGSGELWPEQVTVDGQGIAVTLRDSRPHLRLAPGRHAVAGRLRWDERPRTLPVPPETGLLQLTVDGNRIARPERNGNAVWLGERATPREAANALGVQVYRLVADDVPTRLLTRFTIEVSGGMREERLAPALPEGFVPLSLASKLPARYEAGGELLLQVRPGTWSVELAARADGVRGQIALPEPAANLPDTEIWSYASNDALRVTVPEGLAPVDPRQVSVPADWRTLPAFRIAAGEALTIVERSRGKVAVDNRLELERLLWLDFDGGGYTFSDTIRGTMQSGWRLDMAAPYALQSASQAGADLLVTLGAGEGQTGVELRRRDVDLHALGRADTRDPMPVSGWGTRLDAVTTELNLPPGHKLLAALGAEQAPRAWAERWQLLDFFLVLIITLAAGRMFGPAAGGLAFAALVLSWHEGGAPQWVWLNLLAAAALARVAPAGRLLAAARFYRSASLVVVLALLVPFLAGQLRLGLYPQLEPQRDYGFATAPAPAAAPVASAAKDALLERAEPAARAEELRVTASSLQRYARYAPNAIVQAGPGRPSWSWNSYDLYWNGPVDPEATLTLLIAPRWVVTLLRFLEVLLLLLFAALFVFEFFDLERRWPPRRAKRPASRGVAAAGAALLVAGGLAATPPAHAQMPSPEILQQLEQRLLEPPPCVPRCAEIAEGRAVIAEEAMTIELAVHALDDVAVPIPGSLPGWRPESVRIDGAAAPFVYRGADQVLRVRLPEGRHRLVLQGPLPPVDSLEIGFPAAPRVFTADARGWTLTGIDDRRLVTGSLQLTRLRDNGAADATGRWESSRFPPFVRIERSVELDLDWRVSTRVIRVAPETGAITLSVPLLEGASLLTADLPVTEGAVRVSLGPTENSVGWTAALPRASSLVLRVPEGAPWKEVWRFGIGNIWHAEFSGVPESEPGVAAEEVRVAEFYPRGGESLALTASRPEASRGSTLAFDAVSLVTEVGGQSRNITMTLDYRSTRGAQHAIGLPAGSEIMQVSIDGRIEPLRAEGGELSLPVMPGEHRVEIRWRRDEPAALFARTPPVALGAPASNITLGLAMPADRWLLATDGPRLGPAVLYWSELAAMILFALILGRIPLTPLRTRHWLLLGLGFSTFSWPALMLVAAWLLAVGARARWKPAEGSAPWHFNLAQVGFAALTIAALFAIVVSVPSGLLGSPDMHIAGSGSYGNRLNWVADRSVGALPEASVFSLPLWVYKVLILAWALWLSFALLRWLPWVWRAFTDDGLWRGRLPKQPPPGSYTT